eukprot:6448478-Amphidinium_carterae.1
MLGHELVDLVDVLRVDLVLVKVGVMMSLQAMTLVGHEHELDVLVCVLREGVKLDALAVVQVAKDCVAEEGKIVLVATSLSITLVGRIVEELVPRRVHDLVVVLHVQLGALAVVQEGEVCVVEEGEIVLVITSLAVTSRRPFCFAVVVAEELVSRRVHDLVMVLLVQLGVLAVVQAGEVCVVEEGEIMLVATSEAVTLVGRVVGDAITG